MSSIIDYIYWRGDLSFDAFPPTEVDGLIFSAFSYMRFPQMVKNDFSASIRIQDLAEHFFSEPEEKQREAIRNENDLILFKLMASTPRYADVEVLAYQSILDTEKEVQFAAYTFKLNHLFHAVVYRGTDTTVIGWKEDLNLSFIDDLPGQQYARDYLAYVAKNTLGNLIVCGHSKGGNLAVYAAASVTPRTQKRIHTVYNYDGPGFMKHFLEKPGYNSILSKIETLVPKSSVVGMLLEHEEPYEVVNSTNIGISQHEPYSWEVLGPSFVKDTELDMSSRIVDESLHVWLAGLSREDREKFCTAIHSICMESKPEKLVDLVKPQNAMTILKTFGETDETTRTMILSTLSALGKAMADTMSKRSLSAMHPQFGLPKKEA